MKIDLHTHILPPRWPDLREKFGYGDWIRLEHLDPCTARMIKRIDKKHFRDISHSCWHAPARPPT